MKPCTVHGCPTLVDSGRCPVHQTEARRVTDASRPRGERRYGPTFERNRKALLAMFPLCACGCGRSSNTADHYPTTRRELLAQGCTDPDALHRLRALNSACHNRETARAPRPERRSQKGGVGPLDAGPPSPLGSGARSLYGFEALSRDIAATHSVSLDEAQAAISKAFA